MQKDKWRIDIGDGWIGGFCGATLATAFTGDWRAAILGFWLGAWLGNKIR